MTTQTNLPNLSITGNPAVDGLVLKALLTIAAPAALWFATKLGNNDPNFVGDIAVTVVSVTVVGLVSFFGYVKSKLDQAIAVRAGVNLTVSGQTIMQGTGNGTVTPAPVTTRTAPEIVKAYGHVAPELEPSITDALNAAQLTPRNPP